MREIIYDAYKILNQFAECKGEYICKNEKSNLLRILKQKEYYNEDVVRVVLVGRTNAGKSTLTNALVGKKIAHVRRRESTNWNTCFWPSELEYCIGTKHNDEQEILTVEKFVEIMNAKESQEKYLKNTKNIDVFFKTEDVQFAILDVPGFSTENKENEAMVFEEIRQADVVIFLIAANASVSGDEMALYHEISNRNIPIEIVISKSEYRTVEELKQYAQEIQELFKTSKKIYSISAKECLKNNEEALLDRADLIKRINEYQVLAKEERKRMHAHFEAEGIAALRKLQQKVLYDIDRKFCGRYKEQVELYNRAEDFSEKIRNQLQNETREHYCEPYINSIIDRMIELPLNECVLKMDSIIKECVPESYLLSYWKHEVENMEILMDEMWEKEISNTEQLYKYAELLKTVRKEVQNISPVSTKEERMLGGIGTSLITGTALSFYQAVLGPVAEFVTFFGAMGTTGLPLMGLGIIISAIISQLDDGNSQVLSKEKARVLLQKALQEDAKEVIRFLMDKSEEINKKYILEEIERQEKEMLRSLPEGLQSIEQSIHALEELGTLLLNREIELKDVLDFYISEQMKDTKEIIYMDSVENEIDSFIMKVSNFSNRAHIDTSSRVVFMPILFLSQAHKEHLLSIFKEMCENLDTFKSKIKQNKFNNSYYYKDEICAIYFSQEMLANTIVLDYIDVYMRDEKKEEKFRNKIREGCMLSDCQMRRKIISDISRAKEKVEILVPWMNDAIYAKPKQYTYSMIDAIRKALENGATVTIGCGNSEDRNKSREVDSRNTKEKLAKEFQKYYDNKKLIFYMKSFTHEKFLVVDNRIAMCGSYNYLSNNGDFEEQAERNNVRNSYVNWKNSYSSSSTCEHPGESMKITENVESIQIIRNRMYQKYN